jgi:hypothetical protein
VDATASGDSIIGLQGWIMADWQFRLGDLVETTAAGRPTQNAYSAMAVLLAGRFLRLTAKERAKQVHLGPQCHPTCGICGDIALRHAQWAADKLVGHLNKGVPWTRGVPVRDWVTILKWTTSAEEREIEIVEVREALNRWLPEDDPLLPLVLALSTQLLPASRDARAPRRLRDYVGDPRKSVLAQRHGWAVKPDRDLRELRVFAAARQGHVRGIDLLVNVLKNLDYGDPDPYQTVLSRPETRPGDQAALRNLIEELLTDPVTRDWFMLNVDARHSYNQDRHRRASNYVTEVDGLARDSGGLASDSGGLARDSLPDGMVSHHAGRSVGTADRPVDTPG